MSDVAIVIQGEDVQSNAPEIIDEKEKKTSKRSTAKKEVARILSFQERSKIEQLIESRYKDTVMQLTTIANQCRELIENTRFTDEDKVNEARALLTEITIQVDGVSSQEKGELDTLKTAKGVRIDEYKKKQEKALLAFTAAEEEAFKLAKHDISQKYESNVRELASKKSEIDAAIKEFERRKNLEKIAQRAATDARIGQVSSWIHDQRILAGEKLFTEVNNSEVASESLNMIPSSVKVRNALDPSSFMLSLEELKRIPAVTGNCIHCGQGSVNFVFTDKGRLRCTYCGGSDPLGTNRPADLSSVISKFNVKDLLLPQTTEITAE